MDIAIITITSSACTPAHQFPSRVLIYVITFAVLFIANFAFAFFFLSLRRDFFAGNKFIYENRAEEEINNDE